jgi:hypothetical protein
MPLRCLLDASATPSGIQREWSINVFLFRFGSIRFDTFSFLPGLLRIPNSNSPNYYTTLLQNTVITETQAVLPFGIIR